MTPFPPYLKPYKKEAQKRVDEGRILDVEFSGSTYQVQVEDLDVKEEVWAFIQLDDKGQVRDCFCSCEEVGDASACVHIAAAWLRIYDQHVEPLHIRFLHSLWNQLCRLYAGTLGYDSDVLKLNSEGGYVGSDEEGEEIFQIQGRTEKGKKKIEEIIESRSEETEETSLKFSNLSEEEIVRWKQGRPSSHLSYQLSFWYDLAKWLMLLQDEKAPYSIAFSYDKEEIPQEILITFSDVTISFALPLPLLTQVIPSLATVDSPLAVHQDPAEAIEKITYSKEENALLIQPKKDYQTGEALLPEKGIALDGWFYAPVDGFYARGQHFLITCKKILGDTIATVLEEHFRVIQAKLKGIQFFEEPVKLSYTLKFDLEWNLHITAYLYEPGDLSAPFTRRIGEWIYVEDEGFFRLIDSTFDAIHTVIAKEEISDFVQSHRSWLNLQEGFSIHVSGLVAPLTYSLTEEKRLTFSRELGSVSLLADHQDFGYWIYIPEQGFYPKVTGQGHFTIRPGLSIAEGQISVFIRRNRDELSLIPGFFSETCPISHSGLLVVLDETNRVVVTPEHTFKEKYAPDQVFLFDDITYVEGEGFYQIPPSLQLPERFRYRLELEPENIPLFLNYELETLQHYTSQIDPRLIKPHALALIALKCAVKEKGGYELKLAYQTERGEIPLTALWEAMQQKERFVFHPAGLIDLDEERFRWLRRIRKKQVDFRGHVFKLSAIEVIRIHALEGISVPEGRKKDYTQAREILDGLLNQPFAARPDLCGMEGSLRPYQMLAVQWLWFLYQHGLSGLLCDDMGLGKTHQAMALLSAVHNTQQTSKPSHSLVICPTSVIYHWEDKLKAYLPNFRVCTFHGSNRSLGDFQKDYDILLTSYGIWRNEVDLLAKVPFNIAIFDEIQIAKNQASRIHASLLKVDTKMGLGLTGTPIENHLRELKALFDIVLPGYMPERKEFRETFVQPIEKEADPVKQALFSRFIKPFIMRRKKEDVLLDLPEKVEEVAHCDLSEAQRMLYVDVLAQSREHLLKELQEGAGPIPYIHIFTILSSLKQICNHPAAYLKSPTEYQEHASGKWDLFVELFNEARESGQKVVVFSQYLAMLDIFEHYLNENGIGFAQIRGATVKRGEQIRRFNTDPQCEVFIGSLQAAGLGIDLTAASVVIHYDRWWNAARENQATDRVHRIGQTRGVQVFKLVTKGTFEERIDALIAKKGKMMEEIVGIDDHHVLKQFNRDELIALLQYVE